jgi:hypothetical protein
MATAREENMENELTLEEAQKVIKEYGITPDAYMAANLNHFMNGAEPDDNSVELYSYYTHCLQIVVNNGLAVATTDNVPSSPRQVETLVRQLPEALEEIKALTEHNIPYYGYGDNEAACELANRLAEIYKICEGQSA